MPAFRVTKFAPIMAVALVCAAPAVAHDGHDDAGAAPLSALQDPAKAEQIGAMVEGMTRALLAMPVAPIADAIRRVDPHAAPADWPADATLGDLAAADGVSPQRMGEQARATTMIAAELSRDMAAMLPTWRAMAQDLAAQWRHRMDDARASARR
ncbi:MAG: hypothetical protein ACKOUM_01755 [Sphingopyxis sp.]